MANPEYIMVGLGEVLWDVFPENKKILGGAPANFAYYASLLGNKSFLASRIGIDDLGKELIDNLKTINLDTSFVQSDELVPTGTVTVELDQKNQPSYTINEEVAWDFLEWDECQES